MKKSIMLLGIIAIVLISFSPVYAQPFGHWHNKTISTAPNVNLGAVGLSKFNLTDFVFKRLVDNGASISTGYAVYEVRNPFPVPLPVATDYYEVHGSVVSEQYYIQKTEHYVDYTYTYKTTQQCKTELNGTWCWNETTVDKKIPHYKTRKVWVKTDAVIPAGYKGLFRFRAEFNKPAISPRVSIEWVPKIKVDLGVFDIGGTYFAQKKWAWWNTSWHARKNITITSHNESGVSILEPISIYTYNDSNISADPNYPVDIRIATEGGQEIPYMFTNISGNNTQGVIFLANSTSAGTTYYIYYDGPNETANYSCTLGTWSPCWVNDTTRSLFNFRENFENKVDDWADIGSSTHSIVLYSGSHHYALNVTSTSGSGIDGAYKQFSTLSGVIYASWDARYNDTSNDIHELISSGVAASDGTYNYRTQTKDSALDYYNGSFETIASGMTRKKWYVWNFRINTGGSKYNITVDSKDGVAGATTDSSASDINKLRLYADEGHQLAIDNILISTNEFHTYNNTSTYVKGPEETAEYVSIQSIGFNPPNSSEYTNGATWDMWAVVCNSSDTETIHEVNLSWNGGPSQRITTNTTINASCINVTTSHTDLSAGNYTFVWTAKGNVSSSDKKDGTFEVAKNSSNVVTITITPSNFVSVGTETTTTCSDSLGGSLTLKKDGVVVSNPYTATLDVGSYVFDCSAYVNDNYTTNTATKTLIVGSGETGGCSNNLTYAYKMNLNITNNITILNLSSYHDTYFTRPDLQDVNVVGAKIISINASRYLVINTTGMIGQNITIYWGNYLNDNTWPTGTGIPSTITNNLTNVQEYNNYVFITFRDEINQSNVLPPGANTTLDLFCSGGHTRYVLYNGTTWTHFLATTYDNWRWVYATVKYPDTSFYKRHMGINNNHESTTMWLIDAKTQTVREVVNNLFDLTGDYTTANLTVKKWIGSSLQIVDWQPFDVSNLAYFYGIDGHEYEYTISSGSKSRTLGNVVVSSSDLSKTLVINPTPATNLEIAGNIKYQFNYSDTTGVMKFYYYDPYNNTSKINFTVRYYNNGSLVYYDEQNNTNEYSVTYTVPDPNATYNVTVQVRHHATIGAFTLSFIGGAISTLLPNVTSGFAAIWLRFVAFFAYIATILSVGKRYAQIGALMGGFILLIFSALKFLPLHPAFLVLYFVVVMLWIWRTGVKKATL